MKKIAVKRQRLSRISPLPFSSGRNFTDSTPARAFANQFVLGSGQSGKGAAESFLSRSKNFLRTSEIETVGISKNCRLDRSRRTLSISVFCGATSHPTSPITQCEQLAYVQQRIANEFSITYALITDFTLAIAFVGATFLSIFASYCVCRRVISSPSPPKIT